MDKDLNDLDLQAEAVDLRELKKEERFRRILQKPHKKGFDEKKIERKNRFGFDEREERDPKKREEKRDPIKEAADQLLREAGEEIGKNVFPRKIFCVSEENLAEIGFAAIGSLSQYFRGSEVEEESDPESESMM